MGTTQEIIYQIIVVVLGGLSSVVLVGIKQYINKIDSSVIREYGDTINFGIWHNKSKRQVTKCQS